MDKVFELRPINELVSLVRDSFKQFDAEGLIDPAKVVKTTMYCNEKLGLTIRDVKDKAIRVNEYRAELPIDFERLYYVAALNCSNSGVTNLRNAFDNNIDQDEIYKAELDRGTLGGVDNYYVKIERKGTTINYYQSSWVPLTISNSSFDKCFKGCPNLGRPGKYEIDIRDGYIATPFRTGLLYIVYVANMTDEDGNILYPFHPLITPFYEWSIKESILSDAIFNSDKPNIGELFKLAQNERGKAWIEAFNFTTDRSYNDYIDLQRKKETEWYNQWFRYFNSYV